MSYKSDNTESGRQNQELSHSEENVPSPDTKINLSLSVTIACSLKGKKKKISENNERNKMNLRKTKNPNSWTCLLICSDWSSVRSDSNSSYKVLPPIRSFLYICLLHSTSTKTESRKFPGLLEFEKQLLVSSFKFRSRGALGAPCL